MSEPRDTQFAGFAKLVVDELLANSCVEVIDSAADLWEQVITRRAYDLVRHTIVSIHPRALQLLDDNEILRTVPDMPEWAWPDAPTPPKNDPDAVISYQCATCGLKYHGPRGGLPKRHWHPIRCTPDGTPTEYALCPTSPPAREASEITCTCTQCGTTYSGHVCGVAGWLNYRTPGHPDRAFCSVAHYNLWKTEHPDEQPITEHVRGL
jgi:hypothetical protein